MRQDDSRRSLFFSMTATSATAKQARTWREAFQSSPAVYDPLDAGIEATELEKFHIPAPVLAK